VEAHLDFHGAIIREPGRSHHATLGWVAGLVYAGEVSSAGILIIGNEILSGKVVDSNSPYFCRELRSLGVDVERILTIPDDVQSIASEVKALSDAYDFAFTSGGIGPTHDDLTIEGVAAAFGVPVERSESIVERIRRATGSEPNETLLRMARVPEGAVLVDAGDFWFPLVVMKNVYIFPGIPELLRQKFESTRERFRGVPFVLKRVYVKRSESEIANSLNDLLHEFPELLLGSYPRIQEERFHVMLTLESRDAGYVQRALDSLLDRLPADSVYKVE
jgi:molybdenum cofactor synthesis domain-containing protein